MNKRQRERGASAVEMAIVLPLLILLIAGIIDFGRVFYTKVTMTNVARETARAAVLYTSSADAAKITQRANLAGFSLPADAAGNTVTVALTPADGCVGATTTSVKASVTPAVPFSYILLGNALRFFGTGALANPNMTAEAVMACNRR